MQEWEDVTAQGLVPQSSQALRCSAATDSSAVRRQEGDFQSGTHRVAPPDTQGTLPARIELDAPEQLGRDELCSIIAAYVSCVNQVVAALQVQETLERLGLAGRQVPHPLAGHLVLSLSNHIACPNKRSDFLAHAWGILGGPPSIRVPRLADQA